MAMKRVMRVAASWRSAVSSQRMMRRPLARQCASPLINRGGSVQTPSLDMQRFLTRIFLAEILVRESLFFHILVRDSAVIYSGKRSRRYGQILVRDFYILVRDFYILVREIHILVREIFW